MANNRDIQVISHIKTYCEDVAKSIQCFGDDYKVFASDIDYFNSVSMSIVQIGELSSILSDSFREDTNDELQWNLIRGMRNMYAHEYQKMDKSIIWETATKDIPNLLRFCEKVIENGVPDANTTETAE